jgi:non-specific protein-tyrosine kinase
MQSSSALIGGTVRADDLAYLDRLENTYADLATSGAMSQRVAELAGLDQGLDAEVNAVPNTELMDVQVTTRSPESAARAANALAAELIAHVRDFNSAATDEADRLFMERAAGLEAEIAAAANQQAELERAEPTDANRLEILRLGEEITSTRASLAALRSDHQTLQLARQARSGALSLVAAATPPNQPSNRNLPLAAGLGLALGLIAGVAFAFIAESLTRRFRTGGEIEQAVNSPILATIPDATYSAAGRSSNGGSRTGEVFRRLTAPFAPDAKVPPEPGSKAGEVFRRLTAPFAPDAKVPPEPVSVFNGRSESEEAFRRLATALLAADARRPFKTLLVASADAGEGKTTVVVNVGRTLAQSGRGVLLVDANLRSPSLHDFYGLPNEKGLSDILVMSQRERMAAIADEPGPPLLQTRVPGLWILPSGGAVRDPAMLLGSPQMESWIESAARRFDYIIFDSPAVLDISDAATLARSVDAVLLVTRPDIHRSRLGSAHRELQTLGVRFLGVVVNRTVSQRGRHQFFEGTPASVKRVHE